MFVHFQDYAENLKPTLDAAFSAKMVQLAGDAGVFRSMGGAEVLSGGKKLRGALLCLVATALGGTLESALPRAVAVELIHTATLIHDDFVDQHRSRRNAAALWTLEGARRAVLLGDVVFASAIHMMSELGSEDGRIVSRTIAEIASGAYQEPLNPASLLEEIETGRVDGALYEKIIYLKTGVLFGAACQLGAVAAGADEERRQAWRRYGLKIGEAYQIADDIHDVERLLIDRSVTVEEVAPLVPALLCFAGEIRSHIIEALGRKSWRLSGEVLECLRTAAESMKAEKESRLLAAAAEIAGHLPDSGLGRLVSATPGDVIRMFDAGAASVP